MMRMCPYQGAHPHFVYNPLAKGLFEGGRVEEGLSVSLHSTRRVRVATPPDTHRCKRDAGRRAGSDTRNSVKWVQITRIWFICFRALSYNFVLSKRLADEPFQGAGTEVQSGMWSLPAGPCEPRWQAYLPIATEENIERIDSYVYESQDNIISHVYSCICDGTAGDRRPLP